MRAGLLFLLLFVCSSAPLHAEDVAYHGESTLWQDTVWSGDVLVDGILTVAAGATLEIRPGTVVRFTYFDSNGDGIGEHELFVQGTLLALGRADAPIRFTASDPAALPGAWGAINLMAAETPSRLQHVQVEKAYRGFHAHFSRAGIEDSLFAQNIRAMQFQESEVTLRNCRLEKNGNGLQFRDSEVGLFHLTVMGNAWGVRGVNSRVTLDGAVIADNRINGLNLRGCQAVISAALVSGNRKGIYLQETTAKIRDSALLDNSEHGIFLEESDVSMQACRISGNGRAGIKWVNSRGAIGGSLIDGNGEYALINASAAPLHLPGNWWGSADPGRIAASIRDSAFFADSGPVDINPILNAPPTLTIPGVPVADAAE